MATDKVISRRALKQRLNLFFRRARNYDLGIAEVIQCAQKVGQTAVFGGMLRDLLLYGEEGFKSDIDLVVAGNQEDLHSALHRFSPERTAFGGYRLTYKHSKIDIWCLRDTWAFREGLVTGSGFHDLLKTTFFNWDAIVYLVDDGQFLFGDTYIDSIAERILDINLEPNPNRLGVLRRTFERVYRDRAALTPRLANYVNQVIESQMRKKLICSNGDCNDKFLFFCSSLHRHLEESPNAPFELHPQLAFWASGDQVLNIDSRVLNG